MARSEQLPTQAVRRRSGLVQERSRRTRQQLVRTALGLWAERGFDTGVEDTTVDEIVTAAGVTKGTFYFHFSRKEEILLEMGWESAEALYQEAIRCIDAGRSLDETLRRLSNAVVRQVKAAPPAAVGRAVAEFRREPIEELRAFGRLSFASSFEAVLAEAVARGELPPATDPVEGAQMLEAVTTETIFDWATSGRDLSMTLRRRLELLATGLRAAAEPPADGPAGHKGGRGNRRGSSR